MRPGSPPFGVSTLTTSAPSWARTSVQVGPASNCDRSRTRTPARQFGGTALVSIAALPLDGCRTIAEPARLAIARSPDCTTGKLYRQNAGSAAVGAVDVDIAVRQVAGPDRGATGTNAEIDRDPDPAPRHVFGDRAFVVTRHRRAFDGDLGPTDRDRQPAAAGLLAGLADRHDNAPPIGVAGGERGFHQRRVADRQPDLPRRPLVLGARNLDRDEFLGALAVARQLLRQIDAHLLERAAEIGEARIVGTGNWGVPHLLCGAEQHRVAGRGVAIDGHRIEGDLRSEEHTSELQSLAYLV